LASKKPTAAEHRKRINQVAAMLATGTRRADILQYAAEKWQIAKRASDNYIATATEELRAANTTSREDDVANARALYTIILREQISTHDTKAAAATLDKLCRLLGLDAPTKSEQSGEVKIVVEYE
jgi:hypothetical protein